MTAGRDSDNMQAVLFCDFDGTITIEDLIVAVWRRFAKAGWERQMEAILERRKDLREGVAEIFAGIPASRASEIVEHAENVVQFRPGFPELLAYCPESSIDFVVASGGIDFFVEPVLEPYLSWISKIYTIQSDFSGEFIRLFHPFGCETDGLCKAKVLEEYPRSYRIFVGDGLTDLHGAQEADMLFARGQLAAILDQQGRDYVPFDTFFDVIDGLETAPWNAAHILNRREP